MFKNINLPAFFTLIIYPIILITLFIHYAANYQVGVIEITLIIVSYYGANISVGVGLHRLWSHNAFKINKFVEFILVMLSAGTLQGPALSWASNHYKHHTYTDKEEDPHSPLKFRNQVIGFLWAHIGWMLSGEGSYKSIDRLTMVKLGKNNLLKWQLKYYWQIAVFMNVILPMLIGYCIGGSLLSCYTAFLFIGIGRALQQQATFCVNSLCHFVGTKEYYKGTAGDIWWMALFLLGENWHNFHHAFPSDYRNGAKWYHFDVHKWIIFLMSKVGLAWDLDRTPEVRIQAKLNETNKYYIEWRKQQASVLQNKVDQLLEHLYVKLNELENSSICVKNQLKKSFADAQESLNKIAEQLRSSVQLPEKSSEKILKMVAEKLDNTEIIICKLYQTLDNFALKTS
ncbi:acyl-CoA desaturase [Candidatus Trichorickettsia mobilis]|uniref:acyl-CoA desaturase n=1 Tax=Candidatus Trichorickettsia mobilis TaxID=1346319 RepID=UPI002B25B0B5|nr:fatty acid desaturase [Candidatus Trichorickettsia mobilis]